VLQLTALSFHIPLALISGPQQAMVGLGSGAAVGLAVTATAVLGYAIARIWDRVGWKALAWVSTLVLFFWHWDGLAQVGSLPDWVTSVAVLALCLVAVTRIADRRLFRMGVFAVSVALSGTLLVMSLQARLTTPPASISTQSDVSSPVMSETPDIVFVVLDAYARQDVLKSIYGYDNSPLIRSLQEAGFSVPDSANANYASTHFSLSSMLEMEYLAEPESPIWNSDLEVLTEVISGDNEFVEVLKANGYTYVHGDTDHWLNTCGPVVDDCLHGPVIDVTGDALLAGTAAGPFLYRQEGDPTTALNLDRLRQLENWEDFQAGIESPSFTFLHLVLPHPPLYLDATCEPHVDEAMDGRNVSRGEHTGAELRSRRDAYVAQVECANRAIRDLIAQVDPTAAVIITADHGPDSLEPLTSNNEPQPEQAWERFATFTAIRFPEHCDQPGEDHQLVNTFRLLLGCLTDSRMEELDERYFVAAYSGTVEELKNPDMYAESLQNDSKDPE
jgi:hypothetical protein